MTTSLLWFRRDLRLADHPALNNASHAGDVLGVFIADDNLLHSAGSPRRNFLAGALAKLAESMNGNLLIVRGVPEQIIPELAIKIGAGQVHISADYGPYGSARDDRVENALNDKGLELIRTGSSYAVAPGRVRKADGQPYTVFSPFYRGWLEHGWREPAHSPSNLHWVSPAGLGESVDLKELSADIPAEMNLPQPGEEAAARIWKKFSQHHVAEYNDDRNRPDHPGTSELSPYLKWGCIHPRTIFADLDKQPSAGATSFRRELAWREFYADLLFHRPDSPKVSADPRIDALSWDTGDEAQAKLQAWKAGRTGYPYIDAGMRQLIADGWMHNRLRMAVASFLIKDLHLAWQLGAAHFMDLLVDGDIASNTHGWQWVAGSGAQASPYYRIFNPIIQAEKFDPDGDYVRKYVPELAHIAGGAIHRPWELADGVPAGYLEPMLDHAAEREEALRRWEQRPR